MKPILIVKTASSYDDLPGLCARRGDEVIWFSEACGVHADNVVSVDAYKGAPLPDPEDFQAIIITGSVDMISDFTAWMQATADWLKNAVEKQIHILGVCFGHHLLAHVLGGSVGHNPNGAEFGAAVLHKTGAADRDPLFSDLPKVFEMDVFHYESILDLPKCAVLLASNSHDKNHAFRYGNCVWGVQFHPEFDPEIMEAAIDVYQRDMIESGYDISELRDQNIKRSFGNTLLRSFIKDAYG